MQAGSGNDELTSGPALVSPVGPNNVRVGLALLFVVTFAFYVRQLLVLAVPVQSVPGWRTRLWQAFFEILMAIRRRCAIPLSPC